MNLKIGCSGYPVGRARYHRSFSTVEIDSTFTALPRLATAEKWRREAPVGFEFSVRAWQAITHPCTSTSFARLRPRPSERSRLRYGHFRSTDEVAAAWEAFEKIAGVLRPSFIVFQTPSTFYPNADSLRDMYRFFKGMRRGRALMVWEPRGSSWDDKLVRRICDDLGLQHGVNPLDRESVRGGVRYYRMIGKTEGRRIGYGHVHTDFELSDILERCQGKTAYVYFNNRAMWDDARRFADLADPVRAELGRARRRQKRFSGL